MKKIILVFIMFLISMLLIGCVKDIERAHTQGLEFALIEDRNAYAVTGYTGNSSEVYIDSTYNSLPVIRIERDAFLGLEHVTAITLPKTIEELGKYCFMNTGLPKNITVPDTVYYFGGSFDIDTELHVSETHLYHKEVEIDGVNVILTKDEKELIYVNHGNKDKKTFHIPSSVTKIGYFAMFYTKYDKIIIPDHVTEIGNAAFWYSRSEINIPSKIVRIGESAFSYCKFKGELILPEGLEEIGNSAFGSNELTSIVFPSTLKSLSYSVFANHPNYFTHNQVTRITFKSWRLDDVSKSRFITFILYNYRDTLFEEITIVLPEDEAEAEDLKAYLEEALEIANSAKEPYWEQKKIIYE